MNEHALLLGKSQPVVGIVTEPSRLPPADRAVAVILSNSGIVHRVGPSCAYVRIARGLAAEGIVTARIDHRGIGDSAPRTDTRQFHDAAVAELREVMDDLGDRWGIRRFVIGGICLGASLGFQTASVDDRVRGVVMINGVGHSDDREWNQHARDRSAAQQYLKGAVHHPDSWRRVLTGKSNYRLLANRLITQAKSAAFRSRKISRIAKEQYSRFSALTARGVHLLWIHSADDVTIGFRDAILGRQRARLEASGILRSVVVSDADHTFTLLSNQETLLATIRDWMNTWNTWDGGNRV